MRKFILLAFASALVFLFSNPASAQQYKIRQVTSISGMNSESTIYVKGPRKRTESAGIMGMSVPTTIEQCDKKRIIKLNDKKKLYIIIPFSQEEDEVIDEDASPVKTKPVTAANTQTRKGGVITMYYSITDTGERKKINGFTARHIWTTNKMKASPDACTMKDSFIIKTDGWYIDLPEFNCPVTYKPASNNGGYQKPECQDKFVTRRRGKGKLGFPLTQTTTIIMGGKTSEFTSALETVELSTAKLDSMLFEIPPGYREVQNEEELNDKFDVNAMMDQYKNQNNNNTGNKNNNTSNSSNPNNAGGIIVGVYEPKGDNQVSPATLQQHMINTLSAGTIHAIAVSSPEDAKSKNCTYTLATDISRVKSASKVGGLLKAIKNSDPNAANSFNIEASQTLIKLSDGSIKSQPRINGKYEGKVEEAVKRGMDDGCRKVLEDIF